MAAVLLAVGSVVAAGIGASVPSLWRWAVSVCSSRGEEAGVPEEPEPDGYVPQGDDLVAIVDVVADSPGNDHWRLWEAELARGADR